MPRRWQTAAVLALVLAVAAAAVVDSLRGGDSRRPAAAARTPDDCLDREACRRAVRELVAFYRGCVASWNAARNGPSQAEVVAGGFDRATLFRSTGGRCSIHFASAAAPRVLVARRLEGRWTAAGGGRRPPAADDFRDAWDVAVRPGGLLSLRDG